MSKSAPIQKSKKKTLSPDTLQEMSQSRIITKTLVYVIGLSQNIASKETLSKYEYFGQYGKITKIVINKKKAYNQNNPYGPSYSGYVTYSKPLEASLAILALDNIVVDNHLIRASFGTTKYCSFYLKNMECTNKDCLFLHKRASESDIIKREDLNVNKNIFYEQQLYAIKIADIYNAEIKKKLMLGKNKRTIFPSTDLIYQNEIVIDNEPPAVIAKKTSTVVTKKAMPQETKNVKKFIEDNNTKPIPSKITRNSLKLEINSIKNIKDETTCSSIGEEKLSTPRKVNIYCNREKSRFDFVKKETDSNEEKAIPEFVLDIIDRRFKMGKISKYCKDFDALLLRGELMNNKIDTKDQWTEFIIKNSHYTIDKDRLRSLKSEVFTKEVDKISKFVLTKTNKCKY